MGLERTFYQVSEGVGVVEVCAIVHSPVIVCPIEFQFNVTLSTVDGTAGEDTVKITVKSCKVYCDDFQCLLWTTIVYPPSWHLMHVTLDNVLRYP